MPKTKIVKKKKLIPMIRLRKKLWEQFSLYIRLRDADEKGNIKCCTTGNVYPWNKSQAGHFFCQRGNPALIFDERNVHAQSPIANKLQKNNITWDYTMFMIDKYGLEKVKHLASLRGKDKFRFSRAWLDEKLYHYTEAVKQLKKKKGL